MSLQTELKTLQALHEHCDRQVGATQTFHINVPIHRVHRSLPSLPQPAAQTRIPHSCANVIAITLVEAAANEARVELPEADDAFSSCGVYLC
jgi:hypothetical protein